jgi:pilin isopeptide linkage protein
MRRKFRKIGAILLSAVTLALGSVSSAVAYTGNSMPDLDTSRKASLTVNLNFHDAAAGSVTPVSGAEITICPVASVTVDNGSTIYTPVGDFADSGISFEGMTTEESITAAAKLADTAAAKNTAGMSAVTDENGMSSFTGLDFGIYLVRETGRTGTAAGYAAIAPYLVQVPGIEENGQARSWLYDVTSNPKTTVAREVQPNHSNSSGGGGGGGGSDRSSRSQTVTETAVTPVFVDPPVTKVVNGDTPSEAQEFRFVFRADDPLYPMPEGSSEGVKTASLMGAGSVEFGTIAYTSAGTYSYTVTEEDTGNRSYSYDKSIYRMTVTVTQNETTLTADVQITRDGAAQESMVFVNTYSRNILRRIVRTGDSSHVLAYGVIAGAALMMLVVYIRKKKSEETK